MHIWESDLEVIVDSKDLLGWFLKFELKFCSVCIATACKILIGHLITDQNSDNKSIVTLCFKGGTSIQGWHTSKAEIGALWQGAAFFNSCQLTAGKLVVWGNSEHPVTPPTLSDMQWKSKQCQLVINDKLNKTYLNFKTAPSKSSIGSICLGFAHNYFI